MSEDIIARLGELRAQMVPPPGLLARLDAALAVADAPPVTSAVQPASAPKPAVPLAVRWPVFTVLALALAVSLVAVGLLVSERANNGLAHSAAGGQIAADPVVAGPVGTEPGEPVTSPSPPDPALYASLYSAVARSAGTYDNGVGWISTRFTGAPVPVAVSDTISYGASKAVAQDASGTNVQVEGIDEGDIVKTDGRFLYVASGTRVVVVEAAGAKTRQVAALDTRAGTPGEDEITTGPVIDLLIDGTTLMTLTHGFSGQDLNRPGTPVDSVYLSANSTKVSFFDISDPARPTYLKTISQAGAYAASRLMDGVLYLVSSYYVAPDGMVEDRPVSYVPWLDEGDGAVPTPVDEVCVLPIVDQPRYSVATAISVAEQSFISQQAVLGGSQTVYMSSGSLYLAGQVWLPSPSAPLAQARPEIGPEGVDSQTRTQLVRIALNDGELRVAAQTSVAGGVLNQFTLDEYEGNLRLVTTYTMSAPQWTEQVGLWILDADLNLVGSIPSLVKGESVMSVRFAGQTAYAVTYMRVDPLFTIDVADPADPQVRSALKIPGFSSYLHPWGEGLLLGVGVDATLSGATLGSKLSIYDISDPYDVTEVTTAALRDHYNDVQNDHHSVFVDVERGLVGFPTYTYDSTGNDTASYQLYAWDGSAFTLRGSLPLERSGVYYGSAPARGVRVGADFYTVTRSQVEAYSLASLEPLASVPLG